MKFKISLVTGTLNRLDSIIKLIEQVTSATDQIQIVVVDGGSIDGTQDYLKSLKNNQVKPILFGERSPYPSFMNLGIKNSDAEYIMQFNDDALFATSINQIINSIEDNDVVVFNWKEGNYSDINNPEWHYGDDHKDGFCLVEPNIDEDGNLNALVNYGIYRKKIFSEIGLYYHKFQYYFCDHEMALRAYHNNYKFSTRRDIKILVPFCEKKAIYHESDLILFKSLVNQYSLKLFPVDFDFI